MLRGQRVPDDGPAGAAAGVDAGGAGGVDGHAGHGALAAERPGHVHAQRVGARVLLVLALVHVCMGEAGKGSHIICTCNCIGSMM